jgi:hypothetical protein
MPNWTSNRIYIKGDQADIRAFLEAVKWEDEHGLGPSRDRRQEN